MILVLTFGGSKVLGLTCSLPSAGNWTVSSSCTLGGNTIAPQNVIVQSSAVLTVPTGTSLTMDLTNYHLLVNYGSGVLINSGGKVIQITQAPPSTCTASSGPIGVTRSGTTVWVALSGTGNLGRGFINNCSISSSYSVSRDPHLLAFVGNGKLAFTQKGTQGPPNTSCINAFDPTTNTVTNSACLTSGPGFDDISRDPTNPNIVWTSLYYVGQIAKFDTTTSSINYFNVPTTCGTANPEGLRVDNNGNVWVTDEGCSTFLWKYVPSTNTWSHFPLNVQKTWFLDVDNTNQAVWITEAQANLVLRYDINANSVFTAPSPTNTAETFPFGIAADPIDNRVFVTFLNSGYVDEFFYTTSIKTWLCPSSLPSPDFYGSGSLPYGITYQSPNTYWAALSGTDQLATGSC